MHSPSTQAPSSQPNPGCLSHCRQSTRSSRPCFLCLLCRQFIPSALHLLSTVKGGAAPSDFSIPAQKAQHYCSLMLLLLRV